MKIETVGIIICLILIVIGAALLPTAIDQWFGIGEFASEYR